jgi:hypothetical protein
VKSCKNNITIIHGDKRFLKNLWFSIDTCIIRDNQNLCYTELKKYLYENNIDLSTEDINPFQESELVLFIDVPRKISYTKSTNQVWYLILNEAPCAYEKNWKKEYHDQFDKIFTWDESFIDNVKYFLIRLAYNLKYDDYGVEFEQRKLLTMIAGAKNSNYPGTLYKERYDVIKWFCKSHPENFDLYGIGWPKKLRPIFGPRIESRLPTIFKNFIELFYKSNIVYKGSVNNKREVLSRYKFSICYENMFDKQGFVTEKIFDSMCAGCIPVYLGATNISNLIPSECFIDARNFKSLNSLYEVLINTSESEFQIYQERIKKFIISSNGFKFSPKFFAKHIGDHIINSIPKVNEN